MERYKRVITAQELFTIKLSNSYRDHQIQKVKNSPGDHRDGWASKQLPPVGPVGFSWCLAFTHLEDLICAIDTQIDKGFTDFASFLDNLMRSEMTLNSKVFLVSF